MHMCVHTYIYTHIYRYAHAHTYNDTCTQIPTHTCLCTHTNKRTHANNCGDKDEEENEYTIQMLNTDQLIFPVSSKWPRTLCASLGLKEENLGHPT